MKGLNYFLIAVIGIVLFVPFLGSVHLFDWDEINFAESAREMLVTHNYSRVQINFQPFWEKPPLFIWLQALSMSVFGINEFAARFPNAVTGIVSLLVLFYLGSKLRDSKLGWIWVMVYAGSILPHLYFKSGIIDPLFNLFIFLSISRLALLTEDKERTTKNRLVLALYAGLFSGLAILTKGPAGLLIILFAAFLLFVWNRFHLFIKWKEALLFFISTGLISSLWFGLETIRNGPWFILTFIQYQIRLFSTPDAGHGGPFYYHFVVLLFGCFAATVFIWTQFKAKEKSEVQEFHKWMLVSLFSVLIIFTIVKTKIVHYSSFAYFPISFLAADFIYKIFYLKGYTLKYIHYIMLYLIGGVFAAALILLPYVALHLDLLIPYTKDVFAKEAMKALVSWQGWESAIGLFLLVQIVLSGILMKYKNKVKLAVINLFVSVIIVTQLLVYIISPKIEGYSQKAAIEFFQAHSHAYVDVLGYKSYAHLFYGHRQLQDVENPLFKKWVDEQRIIKNETAEWPIAGAFDQEYRNWLVNGETDKEVYMVTKVQLADEFLKNPRLVKIGSKNGFVFLKKVIPTEK